MPNSDGLSDAGRINFSLTSIHDKEGRSEEWNGGSYSGAEMGTITSWSYSDDSGRVAGTIVTGSDEDVVTSLYVTIYCDHEGRYLDESKSSFCIVGKSIDLSIAGTWHVIKEDFKIELIGKLCKDVKALSLTLFSAEFLYSCEKMLMLISEYKLICKWLFELQLSRIALLIYRYDYSQIMTCNGTTSATSLCFCLVCAILEIDIVATLDTRLINNCLCSLIESKLHKMSLLLDVMMESQSRNAGNVLMFTYHLYVRLHISDVEVLCKVIKPFLSKDFNRSFGDESEQLLFLNVIFQVLGFSTSAAHFLSHALGDDSHAALHGSDTIILQLLNTSATAFGMAFQPVNIVDYALGTSFMLLLCALIIFPTEYQQD